MLLNFTIVTKEACLLGVNGHVCELQLILARYVLYESVSRALYARRCKSVKFERGLVCLPIQAHSCEVLARVYGAESV